MLGVRGRNLISDTLVMKLLRHKTLKEEHTIDLTTSQGDSCSTDGVYMLYTYYQSYYIYIY